MLQEPGEGLLLTVGPGFDARARAEPPLGPIRTGPRPGHGQAAAGKIHRTRRVDGTPPSVHARAGVPPLRQYY